MEDVCLYGGLFFRIEVTAEIIVSFKILTNDFFSRFAYNLTPVRFSLYEPTSFYTIINLILITNASTAIRLRAPNAVDSIASVGRQHSGVPFRISLLW